MNTKSQAQTKNLTIRNFSLSSVRINEIRKPKGSGNQAYTSDNPVKL
jgi:hypothetical protein